MLHQVLQWHHMLTSAGYPPDSVENLEINTFFDGLFHAATYVFIVLGLVVLWRTAHRAHLWWSWKLLAGTMLIGFGLFNLVEGMIDHHLLGIHHVNETVPRDQWIDWDVGFLAWGAAMLVGGWALYRSGQRAGPSPARRGGDGTTTLPAGRDRSLRGDTTAARRWLIPIASVLSTKKASTLMSASRCRASAIGLSDQRIMPPLGRTAWLDEIVLI